MVWRLLGSVAPVMRAPLTLRKDTSRTVTRRLRAVVPHANINGRRPGSSSAPVVPRLVAGLGGSLFMHYISAFNPASWSPLETFLLYGALLVGGTANSFGAVAGAVIVLVAFPQLTQLIPAFGSNSNAGPAVQAIAIGLLIIVVLRFRPAGLLPELKTMSGQLRTAGSWNWRARRAAGSGES